MSRTFRFRLTVGVVVASCFCGLAAAPKLDLKRLTPVPADQPIPVQDFFRPPLFSDPILNSAGTHFAARVEVGNGRTALLVGDLAKSKLQLAHGFKGEDVDWIAWLDDSHLLSSVVLDKRFAKGLYVTDATNPRHAYAIESKSATSLIGVPVTTPMKPVVWIYRNAYDEGKELGVVQVDAAKRLGDNDHATGGTFHWDMKRDEVALHGTRAMVTRSYPKPPGDIVLEYLANKDGELAFAVTATQGNYSLQGFNSSAWERSPVNINAFYPLTVGDRANEIVVHGPREAGQPRALHRMDAATGALGAPLVQDSAYDILNAGFYRHPVSQTILGVKYHRSKFQTVWLDPAYAAVQATLATRFPDQIVSLLGSNRAQDRFFFSVSSDRQPVVYYSFETKSQAVELVRNSAPWIEPARMQPMNVVKFKTRDGYQLEAYLTLPAGASRPNPKPLVVLPHGGPWARDIWGFSGEVQLLASRGYAVLQPNYRGSLGYNWKFPAEDTWAFRKMHDDVTDAVKTAIATGLVDPQRIAIMGSSFGGYLAICGAAFEPDLYRCAVTIAGVFDWETMIRRKRQDRFENPAFDLYFRNLGDPRQEQEKFSQISPLRHIEAIRIPVFVAHGTEDQVVDVAESRRLISELKRHQVPHDSLIARNEGHGMSNVANQVELYSRIETFLAKHLAPAPGSSVPATAASR